MFFFEPKPDRYSSSTLEEYSNSISWTRKRGNKTDRYSSSTLEEYSDSMS